MARSLSTPHAVLAGLALAVAGCEPGSITAAHQQLERGAATVIALTVPITTDTLLIGKYAGSSDTTTTATGLLGLKFAPESVTSAVGQKLQFPSLSTAPFAFSYTQMLTVPPESSTMHAVFPVRALMPGLNQAPPIVTSDTLRFKTPQGSLVAAASVAGGHIYAQITNATSCTATIADTLKDSTGANVVDFGPNSLAAGASVTDTVSLAARSFAGFITLGTPAITPQGACTFGTGDAVTINLKTDTLTLASVTLRNIAESFSQSYAALAGQTDILAVDTVVAYSGSLSLTVQNRLPLAERIDVTLNGVTRGGTPVAGTLTVPAAPGDGSTTSGTLSFNLAGDTIRPAAVSAAVSGSVTASTATLNATVTSNAVVVNGTGSLVIQYVSGSLDPATTPELSVPVQEFVSIPFSTVDFGDLRDAVQGAQLQDATAALAIRNTAQTPVTLSAFTLGLVRLDGSGQPLKDQLGNYLYEKDSTTGQPILVSVVDPGTTTLLIPRAATTNLTLQIAPLADRLVHLILDSVSTAVVAAGTASAGDGSPSRITRTDSASVNFAVTVGLDVTLPDTGVVFTRTEVSDGARLKAADSASVTERLVEAVATAVVTNGTPLGVTLQIAVAPDSLPDADAFTIPGSLVLGPITAIAAQADARGYVTGPVTSTDSVTITGGQVPVLLGKHITTTVRIRLKPPAAGTPAAVRSTDRVIVQTHADVRVRSGGGQ